MNEYKNKLTCITVFDKKSLEHLNSYFDNIEFKLCKLKYDENNREEKDKLPFHSTICVWKNKNHIEIKDILKKLEFRKFELKIIGTKIKKSTQNSYNLYFEFEKNKEFTKIQRFIYENENIRIEQYNPETLIPHITTTKTKITCFQKGEKLLALYTCFFALLLLALSITNFYCMNFNYFKARKNN